MPTQIVGHTHTIGASSAAPVPSATKAAGWCWLARISDAPAIAQVRETILRLGATGLVQPDGYHVTLVYSHGDLPPSYTAAPLPISTVTVVGIDSFDTPDGYAVHLVVQPTAPLVAAQQALYQSMDGMERSPYSEPASYRPHITLAYSTNKIEATSLEPFDLPVTTVDLCDPTERAVMTFSNTKAVPDKYAHIDFSPPQGVREAAQRGLDLRREFGRGGTPIGIARARDLANGVTLSPGTIRRMTSYFARHAVDERAGWGDPANPTNGYIAWMLWGGDDGKAWAEKVAGQMDAVEREAVKAMPSETVWINRDPIKALGDGRVGGYLVAFGGRDKQGEYFTPQTDFCLDWYPGSRPVLYHHGLDHRVGTDVIGHVLSIQPDAKGLYTTARLDLSNPIARKVYADIQAGRIGWSSGSIAHLAIVKPTGEIVRWPIVEASLTPTPAEPYRTTVQALKAQLDAAHALSADPHSAPARGTGTDAVALVRAVRQTLSEKIKGQLTMNPIKMDAATLIAALSAAQVPAEQILVTLEGMDMFATEIATYRDTGLTPEQMIKLIQALPQAVPVAIPVEAELSPEPMAASEDEMKAEVADDPTAPDPEAEAKMNYDKRVKAVRQSVGRFYQQPVKTAQAVSRSPFGAPAVVSPRSRYARMDFDTMSFVRDVMTAAKTWNQGIGWQADASFTREYAAKALTAYKEGRTDFDDQTVGALSRMAAIKSNELNQSTYAGFGDEFVAEGWRAQIWNKPRLTNVVAQNTVFIPMPNDPYKLPIESTDPTVYAVSQTANQSSLAATASPITMSKVGTSNATLASGKLALFVGIAEELNEDSIIPVAEMWRAQAVRSMEDARDYVLLQADDDSGSTNINYYGTSAVAGSKYLYGGGNGFLELALNTAAQKLDQGGTAPTLSKIREARAKLGREFISDLSNLVIYVDPLTHMKLLSIDELNVFMNNGRDATVNTGEVGMIDSIPVYVTSQMGLANTSGFVSSTSGDNTKGRLLIVHKPSWIAGYRREIRTNFDYVSFSDSWNLVVTMRMALARRSSDCASVLYNIAV